MTIYSREYFNILDQDMRNCSTTANMIKRNGFYENAIDIWKNYSKQNHPYQLIALGKLYILTDKIENAKKSFEKCLSIFADYERIIDEPLYSHILSSLELLGYCIRENSDTNLFINRVSGASRGVEMINNRILFKSDEEDEIDWVESKERFKTAIDYLNGKGIHCSSFNTAVP